MLPSLHSRCFALYHSVTPPLNTNLHRPLCARGTPAPFRPIQVYGVLPAATLFMLGYSKVSTLLSKRALFHATALPFFAFYLFFKLVMYPMRASLHPSEAAVEVFAGLPEGMSYVVNLYRNWTFALFYVVSELYSSVRVKAGCLLVLLPAWSSSPITTILRLPFYPAIVSVGCL